MSRANLFGPYLFGASLLSSACDPCECVNHCRRGYGLSEPGSPPTGLPTLEITNRGESGMDCEIDDIPSSLPSGAHTLRGSVQRRFILSSGNHRYAIELDELAAERASSELCEGVDHRVDSVAELRTLTLDEGDTLCAVGEIRSHLACTQKGCGW